MTELSDAQIHFIRTFIADIADPKIAQMFDLSGFVDDEDDAIPQDDIDRFEGEWAKRFAQLDPKVTKALSTGEIKDVGGLRATWALAVERADNGAADAALALLPRVETLLGDIADTREDGPPEGHVEFMQLVIDWQAQKGVFERQLDELSDALIAEHDDPEVEVDNAPQKVRQALAGFDQGLSDKIEALQDAAFPPLRKKEAGDAVAIVQSYLSYVESDPLITHLRQNPYEVDADALTVLGPALRRIMKHLNVVL